MRKTVLEATICQYCINIYMDITNANSIGSFSNILTRKKSISRNGYYIENNSENSENIVIKILLFFARIISVLFLKPIFKYNCVVAMHRNFMRRGPNPRFGYRTITNQIKFVSFGNTRE